MKLSDSAIIDAVLAGDTRRYGELVDRYQNRLMRYVWNLLGNHHDCEEIIQETFIQGFRHLPRFDSSKASFETWLTVIARRKSLNQIQKMRPRAYADPPDTACLQNLNQRILNYEWQQELDDALAKLPVEQRSAFILIEIQEKSYREAAKIEGVPTGTIKSRVGRAKKRLRSSISKPIE